MKQFFITLIYTTLTMIIVGTLFRVLYFPASRELLWGGFWLHIASYLGYSLLAKEKDNRMLIPLVVLVIAVLFGNVDLDLSPSIIGGLSFALVLFYVGFHLLTPNYLAPVNFKIKPAYIVAFVLFAISVVFKIMQLNRADILLLISLAGLSILTFATGLLKGVKPKTEA